jgi:hypothetical protein
MPRFNTSKFLEGIVVPGASVRHCTEAEAAALTAAWLAAFCPDRERERVNATGPRGFLWHIFSAGRYPCVEREDARSLYRLQHAAKYMVLLNDARTAVSTDALPLEVPLADYCVFPPNLAWTMAFTHEAGWLGPYFAKHARFDELSKRNVLLLRKKQAAEAAKAKGWQ